MTITTIKPGQNIPKGYAVAVTSWDNEGDNHATKTVYGLDENEVKFVLELTGMFKCENSNDPDERGLGNSDYDDDTPSFLESGLREEFNISCCSAPYWKELIGTWCDGEYIRVFDSADVYWFDEPVVCVSGMFDSMKEDT